MVNKILKLFKNLFEFHAVCLDTYPPCIYMNDVSHAICNLVHMINKISGKNLVKRISVKVIQAKVNFTKFQACYTFDAGPNACLFLEEENIPIVAGIVRHFFPPSDESHFFRGSSITPQSPSQVSLINKQ